MQEKIIAAIPAYNEVRDYSKISLFSKVLDAFSYSVREGIVGEVVIIDDGSTDHTHDVSYSYACQNQGIEIIRHLDDAGNPVNLGKSRAFLTGLEYCLSKEVEIIFTCDADMIGLTSSQIFYFLSCIDNNPSISMIRSPYAQGNQTCSSNLSGFRAIRIAALEPLYNPSHLHYGFWRQFFYQEPISPVEDVNPNNRDKITMGYSLEMALEKMIPKNKKAEVRVSGLSSRQAGKGPCDPTEINYGIREFTRRWKKETSFSISDLKKRNAKAGN